jgi:hypothetical protein
VPAAAVTPAPVAYINIAALKKLVVRPSGDPCLARRRGMRSKECVVRILAPSATPFGLASLLTKKAGSCEQIRVLQAGYV